MRAYFFNNQYLAGIHNGIQAGHAICDMWSGFFERFLKAGSWTLPVPFEALRNICRDHKTWIILNAGDHDALNEFYDFLHGQNDLPFCRFKEPGLNYATTSVAVVLSDRMFDDVAKATGRAVQKAVDFGYGMNGWIASSTTCFPTSKNPTDPTFEDALARNYTDWEMEFLMRKNRCKLANA